MPKKGIVPGPSRRARSKSANAAVGINPEKQVPTFGDPKLLVTDSNKAASNAPWMVLKEKHSVSFNDCKKLFGVNNRLKRPYQRSKTISTSRPIV